MSLMFRGSLDFLSNFYSGTFWVPELDAEAKSGEHAFNALKSLDKEEQWNVLSQPTARQAKSAGRAVTLRSDWDHGGRVWAMQRVLVAKFGTSDMMNRLLETGDVHLYETNHWHDQFWGDCYCDLHRFESGVNMLGELLMGIRTAGREYQHA